MIDHGVVLGIVKGRSVACFISYPGHSATIPRMANLDAIVKQLEAERDRIDSAIRALRGLGNPSSGQQRKRRTMSAAARQRIAAAQKARWAKVKSRKGA